MIVIVTKTDLVGLQKSKKEYQFGVKILSYHINKSLAK